MNCPRCNATMTPLKRVKCDTGDAQLHQCPRCNVRAFEQITTQPRLLFPAHQMERPIRQTILQCS